MSNKQKAVKWLLDVSTGTFDLKQHGLCYYFNHNADISDSDIEDFLRRQMDLYARTQGTRAAFPIPHSCLPPDEAYFAHRYSGNSMNDESEYGLSRRKLAEWLADELDRSGI